MLNSQRRYHVLGIRVITYLFTQYGVRQRKPNCIILVVCEIKHYVLFLLATNKLKSKNPQKLRCHQIS
jgi:hypothetical protein